MKTLLNTQYKTIVIFLVTAMVILAFTLGFLTGKQGNSASVVLQCSPDVLQKLEIPKGGKRVDTVMTSTVQSTQAKGIFVGSKNGTKYYNPTCGAVKRIKPENYKWFASEEDARLQGYSRAASC